MKLPVMVTSTGLCRHRCLAVQFTLRSNATAAPWVCVRADVEHDYMVVLAARGQIMLKCVSSCHHHVGEAVVYCVW